MQYIDGECYKCYKCYVSKTASEIIVFEEEEQEESMVCERKSY